MHPTLRLAANLNDHLDVNDDEQGAPVWVCSDLRQGWAAIWPTSSLRMSGL
jgi:hypothetical protein